MPPRLALLALTALAASTLTCAPPEPCACPDPAPTAEAPAEAPPAAPQPTAAEPAPADPRPPHPVLPGAERLRPGNPMAQLALDLAIALFSNDAEAVHARFTPALAAEVSPARLRELVAGVTAAHGPPVEVMDAWTTELEDEDKVLPAAAALIRMANEQRFRVLLVLTPAGGVEGFWLRPL